MVTIIFTLAIGLTALMFVLEKKGGLMDRNYIAGVSIIEIMSAHVTVKFFIMAVQIILVLVIATFVFEVREDTFFYNYPTEDDVNTLMNIFSNLGHN